MQQSITITEKSYKGSMLYWGVVAVVVVIFLVTTITYWQGTIEIIDASSAMVEVRRTPRATQ